MYELAVALYMGDGTVEDPEKAVEYFVSTLWHHHEGYMPLSSSLTLYVRPSTPQEKRR